MAVTFRTSQSTAKTSASTSMVITKPTGLSVGDVMVCFINSLVTGINIASGWTTLGTQLTYHATDRFCLAQYKVADAGDVAASNFTFTYASTTQALGGLIAYTGAGTLDVTNQGAVASGSALSAGVTPSATYTDMFLIMVAGAGSGSESNPTTDSYAMVTSNPSWTELLDVNTGVSTAISIGIAWASRSQVTATGNITATVTPASQSIVGSGLVVAGMIETVTITQVATSLTLTGGTNAVQQGQVITQVAGVLTLTGGTQIAKNVTAWTNQSKSPTTWTNQTKTAL